MASRKKKQAEPAQPQQPVQPQQPMAQPGMPMQQPGMMQPGMGMPMQPGMPMQQPGMPMQQPGMPMQQPMAQPGMPMQQPGMMPQQMGMGGNPMMQMMQAMQMMMGGYAGGGVDPAALPFASGPGVQDGDAGLDADIIRPALLEQRVKQQEAVKTGSVLDYLCLNEDQTKALGGVPKGCTIAFAGPPGKGKTRTALTTMARVAAEGHKVAYVVAEEGFHDEEGSGRDDLCSRMIKVGLQATGMKEKDFDKKVLDNLFVLEAQYHKGQSWDDFVSKYRYLVEKEEIDFVIIDSLNMLDPSRNRTADNLSSLKTYNHEKGVTCMCIGQIRDTGQPVGGEQLMHTADVVFLLEEMSLGSKDMAAKWGGQYRDKIDIIRAIKSVTTPTFNYPVRVDREPGTGELKAHDAQPDEYKLLDV
jgi:KaiC/GvpD/RAD55 family RecA-like ATPase